MQRSIILTISLFFLSLIACDSPSEVSPMESSSENPADAQGPSADQCRSLEGEQLVECAKEFNWYTFQVAFERRMEAYELLTYVIETMPAEEIAEIYFLRGTLATAMMGENSRLDVTDNIVSDLRTAEQYDDTVMYYPLWRSSMEVFMEVIFGDDEEELSRLVQELFDIMNLSPAHGAFVGGALAPLPLSTGLPQKAAEIYDAWECNDSFMCKNKDTTPYASIGRFLYYADVYMRVQQPEKAIAMLEQAKAHPLAAEWAYTPLVDDVLETMEERLEVMSALGDDDIAINQIILTGENSCRPCHAK